MNTDAILDFIVEFYIWFIVGGAIILFAIIGFIADKKKIFEKKQNKKIFDDEIKELNKEKNDLDTDDVLENSNNNLFNSEKAYYCDDNILEQENNYANVVPLDEETTEKENDYYKESSIEKPSNFLDEQGVMEETMQKQNEIDENIEIEQYAEDKISKEKIDEEKLNNNFIDDNIQSELEYIDNLDINKNLNGTNYMETNNDVNDDNEIDKNSDGVEVIEVKDNSFTSNKIDDEKLANINDMEQPLNISYSQLKEMVEEIIAEQEKESNGQNDNDVSYFSKNVKQEIKPNLNQKAVENIKQLDQDEDDVWKF